MSFYSDVIARDPRFHTISVVKDVSLLEPGTRAKVAKMIVMAHAAGHELRVGETYRSQRRQATLFAQHLSELKTNGCHGFGVACDLQLFINGKYDPKGEDYAFFGAMCREVGLISGIDWGTPAEHHTFHDWDHVQNVPVFRQPALFAGTWYPPADYDPFADQAAHGVK